MRVVKFRAFQEKHSKMVYGDMLFINGVSDGGSASIDTTISNLQLEYKLMQFTGLPDKNGKQIFEGDVLRFKSGMTGVVVYDNLRVEIEGDEHYLLCYCIKMGKGNAPIESTDEVIGNIYENPQLNAPQG